MDEYYCSDRAAPYSRGISGSVYYKRSEDCFNIPKDAAPLCKNDNPPRLNISSTTASTLPSLPHKLPINNSVLSTPATPEMRTDQRAHIVEVHEHQISSNKLKETRMHSGLQSHQRMQKVNANEFKLITVNELLFTARLWSSDKVFNLHF